LAFLTLVDSLTLNVEKNSLTILPHSVGSSRKGMRPAFTPCYRAFGIRFTVRGASLHRPNGSRSPPEAAQECARDAIVLR
jgi:hypothetical protein